VNQRRLYLVLSAEYLYSAVTNLNAVNYENLIVTWLNIGGLILCANFGPKEPRTGEIIIGVNVCLILTGTLLYSWRASTDSEGGALIAGAYWPVISSLHLFDETHSKC
jgi:hypothetical protein